MNDGTTGIEIIVYSKTMYIVIYKLRYFLGNKLLRKASGNLPEWGSDLREWLLIDANTR